MVKITMNKAMLQFQLDQKIRDLASLALTIKRTPFVWKNKKLLKRNAKLREIRRTDRCYILGTGPSLKNVDLSVLDADVMVVNNFYRFAQANVVNPLVYFMVDPGFFITDEKQDVINAREMYPDTSFVLCGKYLSKENIADNVYWWCGWGPCTIPKKVDMTKVMPSTFNVIGTAIATAIYMGYKEIVLLGCDFSSFASQKQEHCYDGSEPDERFMDMYFDLYCYSIVAKQHMELYQLGKHQGCRILNATEGSLIDAYPRVHLEDLIKK